MLLYKIKDDEIKFSKSGDYSYMMNLIMEDYTNYFKASEYLQGRYEICLQAIYSCLSKVNNLRNKSAGHIELSRFLDEIRKRTGIHMQIISKDKLYVKEKKKKRLHY